MKLFNDIPRPLSVAEPRIALALSGGGVRAMNFHLGALTCLAQHGLLERVVHVSTVSGGSLLAGLIFKANGWVWPTSEHFLQMCAPTIRDTFHDVDLKTALKKRWQRALFNPRNWRTLSYRGRFLQEAIEVAWGVTDPLQVLPSLPIWSINTTCMETGRRWRFRQGVRPNEFSVGMGDGVLGYADATGISVAAAMAMSAAFPFVFTPLVISTGREWRLPDFNDPNRSYEKARPPYPEYHLADGGIYDNLGLEPLFDASSLRLRDEVTSNFLIALDGGAPLQLSPWSPWSQRLGITARTLDIMSSQQRHLRVRGLVNAIRAKSISGVIARIDEPAAVAVSRAKNFDAAIKAKAAALAPFEWLSERDVEVVAYTATDLGSGTVENRALIERQGYEATYAQLKLYG